MSLWSFSVKRWQFTLVVFALLIATGLWALTSIPRAEDPSLKFPGSLVMVQYPGADPEDVERLVVDPIEDALSELEDIKRLEQLRARRPRPGRDRVHLRHRSRPQVRRGRARDQRREGRAARRRFLAGDQAIHAGHRQHRAARARERRRALARAVQAGRKPRRADRDRSRRAPCRNLGLSGAGSARRRRPRAPRCRARHAR